MATIAQQINSITKMRENDMKPIYIQFWNDSQIVLRRVYEFGELIKTPEWKILISTEKSFKENITPILEDFGKLYKAIQQKLGRFDYKDGDGILHFTPEGFFQAVESRITKKSIEILVAGPVSSGKSIFLRALTGLDECIVPSGNAKTTATTSTFHNSREKSAYIEFYTENEFKDIINCYVENLNKDLQTHNHPKRLPKWETGTLSDYKTKVENCESFATTCFSSDTIDGIGTLVTADAYFKTFQDFYIKGIDDYKDKFKEIHKSFNENELSSGELIPYVSYRKSLNDDSKSFIALAVKHVTIKWPLKFSTNINANEDDNNELENITLVDSMGIGEAKFKIEEELLESIKTHADIAVSLIRIKQCKPDYEADESLKYKHYLKVLSKVNGRHLSDWVYTLCNLEDNLNYSETEIEQFQKDLWRDMTETADDIQLNFNLWRAISFKKNGTENAEEIREYFNSTILKNLSETISQVDTYFKEQLPKEYKAIKSQYDEFQTSLNKVLSYLPQYSDDEKAKRISNEVKSIVVNMRNGLEESLTKLQNIENDKRKDIIKSIRPLLLQPAVFEVVGVKNAPSYGLIDEKSSKDNLDILSKNFYRLFNIANETISSRIVKAIKNDDVSYSIFDNLVTQKKELMESVVQEASKYKSKDGSSESIVYPDWILEFMQDYFEAAVNGVKELFSSISSQTNTDNVNNINLVGRELYEFYRKRERLYDIIVNRFSLGSENVAIHEQDIINVKNLFAKVLMKNLANLNEENANEENAVEWLKQFADKLPASLNNLQSKLHEFLNSTIDLSIIVGANIGERKRRILLQVAVEYSDELTAASQFWDNLSYLDYTLRSAILKSYEDTFKLCKVFDQEIVRPLLNNVFNFNVHNADENTNSAFNELNDYIRICIEKKDAKSDNSLCKTAADNLRKLLK